MRRRFAVALAGGTLLAVGFWAWQSNDPPEGTYPGRLVTVLDIAEDGLGGLSGLDYTVDGSELVLISDRGSFAHAEITRRAGRPEALHFVTRQMLVDPDKVTTQVPQDEDWPLNDAEGLAITQDGVSFVSFEHEHRVLQFRVLGTDPDARSYTPFWGALGMNSGLEALAVAADGTLYAVPEGIPSGAWEAPVYRRGQDEDWYAAFTLPVTAEFKPVGADIGPDGRLYILERRFHLLGFYSRVRSMEVGPRGVTDIRTELSTHRGDHGNLEGIAVWRDAEGHIRLTMVSDNNYLPVMRNQLVEYVLDHRVAQDGD